MVSCCAILLVSCDDAQVCEDYSKVPLRVGFYRMTNNQPARHSIDSITIFGLGNDSIIYNNAKNVSSVELPLDPSRDSTAFVFVFPEINDTIWLYYDRKLTLISIECGFLNHYELQKIEHGGFLIRSAQIMQPTITNNLDEHIRIFPLITGNL